MKEKTVNRRAGATMSSLEALKTLSSRRTDEVVVVTMTSDLEWPTVTTHPELDVPVRGCMSKASSVALGIALAQPNRRVIVLDADGSLLMNLGSLVTIANAAPRNLAHIVLENRVYHISGDQPLPCTGVVDFAGLALSAGYRGALVIDDVATLERRLNDILLWPGPILVCLRVAPLPRDARLPDPPPVYEAMKRVAEELRSARA